MGERKLCHENEKTEEKKKKRVKISKMSESVGKTTYEEDIKQKGRQKKTAPSSHYPAAVERKDLYLSARMAPVKMAER